MQVGARPELGEFLRQQRALMQPPERPGNGRASSRRVPGFRRQELAEAAGISVEYYTRLEQGRAPRPSREILTALQRAFGLSTAERDLLFRLAGEHPPELEAPASVIRPGLEQLLRGLDKVMPVTVHDGRLDFLAANEAASELLGTLLETGPFGRNVAYLAFTSPKVREVVGDEGAEQLARVTASELRMALSRYSEDPYLRAIFRDLTDRSEMFRAYWELGEVGTWRSAMKLLHHPEKGWLRFESEMLHDPENDHWIMLYTPHGDA
jgi:transcriptional regulator with XRE-family HTH domain